MVAKKVVQLVLVFVSLMAFYNCSSQSNNQNKNKIENNSKMKTIVVDVRTVEEWNGDGHADCSVNYPLDQIQSKVDELKKFDQIILVCRSGNRAGIAKQQLEAFGIKNIENKGAWQNVECLN